MSTLFRILFTVLLFAVAAVFVSPNWSAEERTLELRLREGAEIRKALWKGVRAMGEEVVRQSGDEETPPVSAAPPESAGEAVLLAPGTHALHERITADDQTRLDRLVEERLGEGD